MRAIVRITLAITKQATPAATAQRCEQIIEADPEDARTRGVDAVVSKPFRIADLQRVVAGVGA